MMMMRMTLLLWKGRCRLQECLQIFGNMLRENCGKIVILEYLVIDLNSFSIVCTVFETHAYEWLVLANIFL